MLLGIGKCLGSRCCRRPKGFDADAGETKEAWGVTTNAISSAQSGVVDNLDDAKQQLMKRLPPLKMRRSEGKSE